MTSAAPPCFSIDRPSGPPVPVVVNTPHSGSYYPPDFLAMSALPRDLLRQSEDCFVDELVAAAPGQGATLLRAHYPRVYLDTNREPGELDPAMFSGPLPSPVNVHSPRVAGGFGVIPRLVGAGRSIYARRLPPDEAQARLDHYYHPYHQALAGLLNETRQAFGVVLLLDCHSMPSSAGGPNGPDFSLGDRFGAACDPALVEAAMAHLRAGGYKVMRNAPYAGAYNIQTYGRPAERRHALQIEINRALYMDEVRLLKNRGFGPLAGELAHLIGTLGALLAPALDRAAE